MIELVVTRGLPASGKSTYAREWVSRDVRSRARVERDMLRAMMHDSVWKGKHTERQIIAAEHAMVGALLSQGISVIVSDTNLDLETFNGWKLAAGQYSAALRVEDFRHVPLAVCLERNAKRTGKEFIPEDAIKSMHERFIKEMT